MFSDPAYLCPSDMSPISLVVAPATWTTALILVAAIVVLIVHTCTKRDRRWW
jgi:hypothetical protein